MSELETVARPWQLRHDDAHLADLVREFKTTIDHTGAVARLTALVARRAYIHVCLIG